MGNQKAGIMNNKYMMCTIDEYFNAMKKQAGTNSKIVAKSLVKYLKSKENEKALAA